MAVPIISRDEASAQGLKRFFTGEPCYRGHVAERYVKTRACVACALENYKAWYRRHPETAAAWRARDKAKNPDRYRKHYKRNAEKRKAQANEWYHANKERALGKCKDWADRNRDKVREMSRHSARKRRAIKAAVGGTHTRADLDRIFNEQRGKCALCKCSLAKVVKELDHIVPISRGGDNGPANLQWLCRPCNRSKSNKDPVQFAQERGLLL
jgi:5-methylcytosine-specific restriction endonuclease McrA